MLENQLKKGVNPVRNRDFKGENRFFVGKIGVIPEVIEDVTNKIEKVFLP